MALKLPKLGGNGMLWGAVLLGFGFVIGSALGKGAIKYVDKYSGGIIPDEFTGIAQADPTFYFPEFNQRVVIA